MKKRILSLTLALALCLGLSVPVTAAGGANSYLDSGSVSMDKLSKEEIVQLLENNPLTLPDNVFDQVPSCSAPYAAGQVKTSALQAATDRLNALRQIAGLPAVQLDLSLSEQAQYGAVIIAAQGALSHAPSQPADMDDAFYDEAYEATSSSNLYAGRTLTTAVDGFMNDSDAGNIDRVGHRRWQLNPQLGKIGFGYAESNTLYRTYVAEKVFDRSGKCGDYEFVAWPASGNFPSDLFGGDIAWSVSLNPNEYSVPRQSDLTVTLTRENDGRTWTFQGSDYTASNSGAYFHVDTGNYGISNCIIFRPDGISAYEGTYTVEIDGLRTRSGVAVQDFAYQVEFFDLDDPNIREPEQSEGPMFSDVPTSHWAHSYVTEMAILGAVSGVGDGKFAPDRSVSTAEFSVMLSNLFFADELAAHQGGTDYWWRSYADVLIDVGALEHTTAQTHKGAQSIMEAPITRYDMAQIMYNILTIKGVEKPDAVELQRVADQIADYASIPATYTEAVTAMYAMGCLSGVDSTGTFGGNSPMSRAAACVVLSALFKQI